MTPQIEAFLEMMAVERDASPHTLSAYGRVRRRVRETADLAASERPDAVVLIDSWGFTIRVAKAIRAARPDRGADQALPDPVAHRSARPRPRRTPPTCCAGSWS